MTNLFHYCTNETFVSIITNKSIRLSALSLSNDSMEGKLSIELLCEIARKDGFHEYQIPRLRSLVNIAERAVDGLGLCLSENGDLLSQWRAYSNDGAGVSIGFSRDHFEETSVELKGKIISEGGGPAYSLERIIYDKTKQREKISPIYDKIKKYIDEGAFLIPGIASILEPTVDKGIDDRIRKARMHVGFAGMELISDLFLLKIDAFSEEREWRLISYTSKDGGDECSFASKNNRIIPFREYSLDTIKSPPIAQIIKGPKNITPDYVIKKMLSQHGFDDVEILQSKATYR